MRDMLILGGGAAGLFAAVLAAEKGMKVTVLEHKERVGKKILATGNGRCNYTNLVQKKECYRGENPDFAWNAVNVFGAKETMEVFERLGILPKSKKGYIYPMSEQAADVLDVLRMNCEKNGVTILTDCHVEEVKKHGEIFQVKTNKGVYTSENVLLSTGGKAASVHGSDGSGYTLAKQLGHTVTKVYPALTSMYIQDTFMKNWTGVRVTGCGKLREGAKDGKVVCTETGEYQMVDYGISGIPVFQMSRYAASLLGSGKKVYLDIDFLTGYSKKSVLDMLQKRIQDNPSYTVKELLLGILHKKLSHVIIQKAEIGLDVKGQALTNKEIETLVSMLKGFQVQIQSVNSYEKAQVTAGGISTEEIHGKTMESKIHKGLYFAGEVIDIDGTCGGYNLQWAWTSAYLAVQAMTK